MEQAGADDVDQIMSRPRAGLRPNRCARLRGPHPTEAAGASVRYFVAKGKYLPNSPGQCATIARQAYCHPCICDDMQLNYETQ